MANQDGRIPTIEFNVKRFSGEDQQPELATCSTDLFSAQLWQYHESRLARNPAETAYMIP